MKDPYKNIAAWYNILIGPFTDGFRSIGLKMFPVRKGMKVLDMGCGTGTHLKLYQENGCHVFGIDRSEAMIQIARRTLGKEAKLERGDAANTPFPNDCFDLIYSMTVLHEMYEEDRIGVLEEAKRILKSSGRILLIDFHNAPPRKFKGIVSKIIINFFEFFAGKKHFKNYRQFIKNGALPSLIESQSLKIERKLILSGGTFGIFLLKK